MLRFIRSLRRSVLDEGSDWRYLKYACGEIVLVVIGILIALQINSWNEDRLDRKKEREILASMLTDLDEDVRAIDRALRGNRILIEGVERLLALLTQPLDDPEARREMFIHSLVYTYWYIRVDFSELTMSQLKSSGGLRLIGDPEVKRAMLQYDRGLALCKYQYGEIRNYFHAYEARQKRLLNMSLGTQAFAHIEENYLNMLEPIEKFEPLVPVGAYLIDDDPKLRAIYFTDLMFYKTALKTSMVFIEQQKSMAESLIERIQQRYGIH